MLTRACEGSGTLGTEHDILASVAAILGIFAVFLLRPARPRPVPARVVPGDAVCTDDGTTGVVVRLDHELALVQVDAGHAVWCETAQLMDAEGDVPPAARDAAAARISADRATGDAPDAAPALEHFPVPGGGVVDGGGALGRLAAATYDARGAIAIGWLLVVLCCMPFSSTAEKSLTAGGFTPQGETQSVIDDMTGVFGLPIARVQVIVPGTASEVQAKLDHNIKGMYRVPHVVVVGGDLQESHDHKLTTFTVQFDEKDEDVVDSHDALLAALEASGFDPKQTQLGGTPSYYYDIGDQTKRDLMKAERIGIPLALAILLVVFGTAVAASLPLAIGMASVVVTLALIHVLSVQFHLSIYVMNIASMLGLGLGIDYSLLGVSRFREELAAGRDVRTATINTVMSAGRAAAISGAAVMVGMSALAVIPLKVMGSMALAGVIVVLVSAVATLTLLPALLAMLGPRIERLPVRPRSKRSSEDSGFWYHAAHAVMRRPGLAIVAALAILVVLAAPVRHVMPGVPHDDVLPASAPARVTAHTLEERFGIRISAPLIVELWTTDAGRLADIRGQLGRVHNVRETKVIATNAKAGRSILVVMPTDANLGGPTARKLARDVRAQVHPGVRMRLSGQGPGEIEFLGAITGGVPKTLLLVMLSTFVILLLAFRSVALPLKAIVLDTLSIFASLGCVVSVFQLGHGAQLLGTHAMGYTEATIPIVQFCVLFGLSMDYEVFMLARISELYQMGYGNREATARGVAGTAPLVTGAALILIALGLSFATTQIVLVKQIGFGMAVALALDATLVRFLLLPATMRYLGDINWWLPRSLMRRIPRISWAH